MRDDAHAAVAGAPAAALMGSCERSQAAPARPPHSLTVPANRMVLACRKHLVAWTRRKHLLLRERAVSPELLRLCVGSAPSTALGVPIAHMHAIPPRLLTTPEPSSLWRARTHARSLCFDHP